MIGPHRIRSPLVGIALTITLSSVPAAASASDPVDTAVADQAAAIGSDNQHGNASYYAKRFAGRKTASGERYDPKALTAAHRSLPMGTRLRITNPKNDRSVVVTVNDRGRLPKNRVVDVSSAAADALDMKKSGVTHVVTRVEPRSTGNRGAPTDTGPLTDATR